MFDNLKEKIMGVSPEKKADERLINEDSKVARYTTEVLSVSDSAYLCSMGAKTCYGLQVDKSYEKNKAHISRIVGMGHDSVSAHSNVIALIKVNGDVTKDLMECMPAMKFMNVVHLTNKVVPESEDGEVVNEEYLLVSGTVRAFRYFFMTYDFYNEDVCSLALQFLKIAAENFEREFFEKLLPKTELFNSYLPTFEYLAPLDFEVIEEKNEETGEIEEIANIDENSPSFHFKRINGERVDIVYADDTVSLLVYLKGKFPNTDEQTLIKAIADVSIVTIRLHDYSRAISQQVNRHMSGISQESQRYVDYSKAHFIDPTEFDRERYPDKDKIYTVNIDGKEISGTSYELGVKLQSVYPQLREQGMLPQDARGYLPFSVDTKAIHSFTLTNYIHFIKVRTPKAAQPEIRYIAREMASAYKVALNQMTEEVQELTEDEEDMKYYREAEVAIRKYLESVENKD